MLLILAACAPRFEPVVSAETYRVERVTARFVAPGERRRTLETLFEEPGQYFPPPESGLTRARVTRDAARALERGMGPASRSGTRAVNLRYDIYWFTLSGYVGGTRMFGWLEFSDAGTGEVLARDVVFDVNPIREVPLREVSRRAAEISNPVRAYDALMALAEQRAPEVLPRP